MTSIDENTDTATLFAARLAALGIVVWTARRYGTFDPNRKGNKEFARPTGWQQLDADSNGERLAAWKPGMALCATMGGPVAVVDVDVKNGGDVEKVRGLLAALDVRIFAEVETPSGGAHFYVAGHADLPSVAADGNRDGLTGFPGVEVVSFGRNVFLPGTRRPKYDGRGYRIVFDDLEALGDGGDVDGAEALAAWVAENRTVTPTTESTGEHSVPWEGGQPDERQRAYLDNMLTRQCAELAAMQPDSGRNGRVYSTALVCGSYVAGAGMDEATVTRELLAAAGRCGLVDEDGEASVLASIRSGLRNGKKNPKRVPEAEFESDGTTFEFVPDGSAREPFWDARPELSTIHQFAHARLTSPWAVFGVVLCRLLTMIPSRVVLPPIIGGYASLNLIVAVVAKSGSGKGAAERAAKDLLPGNGIHVAPAGSGEGLAKQYAYVTTPKGSPPQVVREREAVMFSISEVDTLTAISERSGSTIMSCIRSAFSGEEVGFSYADPRKRILLGDQNYRLTMVVGVQPMRADRILDDSDGGTPQRFLWLPAIDPSIPDEPVDEPDILRVDLSVIHDVDRNGRTVIGIPASVAEFIRSQHIRRQRGTGDALDGHAILLREKVAAALALLNGRRDVNEEDWELSGIVMARSDSTRASVVKALSRSRAERNEKAGQAEALREIAKESVKETALKKRAAQGILRNLRKNGPSTIGTVRKSLRSDVRPLFDDALDELTAAGVVDRLDGGLIGAHE